MFGEGGARMRAPFMKNEFVRGLPSLIRTWWFPFTVALGALTAVIMLDVLKLLPHGSLLETEIDVVSTAYFMTTSSALTVVYWLRHSQTGFRQDALASVAFFQLFLSSASLPLYSLAIISEELIPNIAAETIIILAIGMPGTAIRKKFSRRQLMLLLTGPTLTTLAFLIFIRLYSDFILSMHSNIAVDLLTHLLIIVAAIVLVHEILGFNFTQFRMSLMGLYAFSIMQITGNLLHLLSKGTFDLAWWLSSVLISQSLLFVAWGVLLDYRWFNSDLRGAFKVMRDGHNALSTLTQRDNASSVIDIIPPVFQNASVFCYTSMDGANWELESEAMSYRAAMERMPRELNIFDSDCFLRETNSVTLSSQDTDVARKLRAASAGVPCVSVVVRATNGRFHMLGMRERNRIWWERSEITMLQSIAAGIGFLAFQRESSIRQSRTVAQLLSMIHASDSLFSDSEIDDTYDITAKLVSEELGFENVTIWKVDGEALVLHSMASTAKNLVSMEKGYSVPRGVGMIGKVAATGKTVLANDVTSEPAYFDPWNSDVKSELDVPITCNGEVIAILDVRSSLIDAFSRLDTEVISSMARLLSVAVEARTLHGGIVREKNLAEARAGLVSHDLRNIFQPMKIYMQLLLDDLSKNSTVPASDIGYIRKTLSSIDSALGFLENTLKIMKLQAGSIAASTDFDLRRIVEDSANLIKQNFTSRNINFTFDFIPDAFMVRGNSLLGEIFTNLFSNAVKYCTRPVVEINVKTERLGDGTLPVLRVRVSDNGGGISHDRRETLFHRFDRAAKGTGLGLSLVREIVESAGGKIGVEERIQGDFTQGTTFVIDFKSAS